MNLVSQKTAKFLFIGVLGAAIFLISFKLLVSGYVSRIFPVEDTGYSISMDDKTVILGEAHLNIPRAYFVDFEWKFNKKYDFVELRLVYPSMSPWAMAMGDLADNQKVGFKELRDVYVILKKGSGISFEDRHKMILRDSDYSGVWLENFHKYKIFKDSPAWKDVDSYYLEPIVAEGVEPPYMHCGPGNEMRKRCWVYTNFKGVMVVQYTIRKALIHEWQDVDRVIKELLQKFIVD